MSAEKFKQNMHLPTIKIHQAQKSPHKAGFFQVLHLFFRKRLSVTEEDPARPWEQFGEELIEISSRLGVPTKFLHNTAGAMQVAQYCYGRPALHPFGASLRPS